MRYPYAAFAPSLIALTLLVSGASAQQQNVAPPMLPNATQEPQKPAPSTTPQQQRGVDDAIRSKSGQAGAQEPSATTTQDPTNLAVLVNGAWNVPGAPTDSQTVPAKFSKRNAALDNVGKNKN